MTCFVCTLACTFCTFSAWLPQGHVPLQAAAADTLHPVPAWAVFGPAAPAQTPRHTVGFGMGYQPGPGLRLLGQYEYAGFGPGRASFTLGWSEQVFGSVGYAVDLWPGTVPAERLSLLVSGFSDYYPNRLLDGADGAETDERRTGGGIRLELGVQPRTGLLSVHLEGQYIRVELAPEEGPNEAETLTGLDLGAHYLHAARAPSMHLAPRLRLGMSLPSVVDFATFALTGSLRHRLGRPLDLVIDGRLTLASTGTPRFEQASFGGLPGVRGFRPDAAMGRRLWILQNELWTPVPGTGRATEGLGAVLHQHVRLAGFIDLGGIYRTLDAEPGTRVGLGLRLLLGIATLRLDWAHGLGSTVTDRTRGRLYVSVGSTIPM